MPYRDKGITPAFQQIFLILWCFAAPINNKNVQASVNF